MRYLALNQCFLIKGVFSKFFRPVSDGLRLGGDRHYGHTVGKCVHKQKHLDSIDSL